MASRFMWDDVEHPLKIDLQRFFDNSISRRPSLLGSSNYLYLQNLSFQSMGELVMFFSPSERLVVLRKYTNDDNDKIIDTIDEHSASVYFDIKADSEYIMNVWIRHYKPASRSMKDLAVVISEDASYLRPIELIFRRSAPTESAPAALNPMSVRMTLSSSRTWQIEEGSRYVSCTRRWNLSSVRSSPLKSIAMTKALIFHSWIYRILNSFMFHFY